MFPSFQAFDTTMTACTSNRECLVLDNTQTSNEVRATRRRHAPPPRALPPPLTRNANPPAQITDCVFWYKAEVKEPFRMGSEKFWKYGQRMQKRAADSDSDSDDDVAAGGLRVKKLLR